MITEAILNLFLSIGKLLFGLLNPLEFVLPHDIFLGLAKLMYGVGYFLPVAQLLPILYFSVLFNLTKVSWECILRVKSFIPTMGH